MKTVLIYLLILLIHQASSTNIECLYRLDNWTASGDVYVCDNQNHLNILSSETAVISSSNGIHINNLTNKHVTAYLAYGRNIEYFPRGLEYIYEKIKAIFIQMCGLKMIKHKDISVFSNLIELNLGYNRLDVLEDDLLSHNSKLKFVHLSGNKFIHIGLKVFDNLTSLSYLFIASAKCINKSAQNSTSLVKEVISIVKDECYNSDYVAFTSQVNQLQNPLNCVNSTYHNQLRKLNESDFATSALFLGKLDDYSKNKKDYCTSEKINAIENSVIFQKMKTDQQKLEKLITDVVDKYVKSDIGNKITNIENRIEELMASIKKLNSSRSSSDANLEERLTQMSIRTILIGVSANLVTLFVIVAVFKAF